MIMIQLLLAGTGDVGCHLGNWGVDRERENDLIWRYGDRLNCRRGDHNISGNTLERNKAPLALLPVTEAGVLELDFSPAHGERG
jgi:hypothetical protein